MINGKEQNQKPPNRAGRIAKKGLSWLVNFIFWGVVGLVSMNFIALGTFVGNPGITAIGVMITIGSITIYVLRRRIAAKITGLFRKNK